MRALGQNPTESEVKKLVHEHRADDRVTFEVFLPIMQVPVLFRGKMTVSRKCTGRTYVCVNLEVKSVELC